MISSERLESLHRHRDPGPFLLPKDDPIYDRLTALMSSEERLQSERELLAAGFTIDELLIGGRFVATHPEIAGYQIRGRLGRRGQASKITVQRIGVERVALYLKGHGYDFIYQPECWLFPVGSSELIIVEEQCHPLSKIDSIQRYEELGVEKIAQLVEAWAFFGVSHVGMERFPALPNGRILWSPSHELGSSIHSFDRHFRSLLDEEWHPVIDRARYRGSIAREYELAMGQRRVNPRREVADFLLPADHSAKPLLDRICQSPLDFFDGAALERAGFQSADRRCRQVSEYFMVFSHPEVPHYLFKAYRPIGDDPGRARHHLTAYLTRARNAREMKRYVEERGFSYIAVPNKWLYPLPSQFATPELPFGHYLMVVDRLSFLSNQESRQFYQTIPEQAMRELVEIWFDHPRFEGGLYNVPVTEEGKIAIIDTERCEVGRLSQLPVSILNSLSEEVREFAIELSERKMEEKFGSTRLQPEGESPIEMERAQRRLLSLGDCFQSVSELATHGYVRVGEMAGGESILRNPRLPGYRVVVTVGPFRSSERVAFERYHEGPKQWRDYIERRGVHCLELTEVSLITLPTGRTAALEVEPRLVSPEENLRLYREMREEMVEELLQAIFELRIWGVGPEWMPFATSGKLAWRDRQRIGDPVCKYEERLIRSLAPEYQERARERRIEFLQGESERLAALSLPPKDPFPALAKLLMPDDHPIASALAELFTDPRDYVDRSAMEAIGWQRAEQPPATPLERFVVASHPTIPGYLVKCYALMGDRGRHYAKELPRLAGRVAHGRHLREVVEWAGLDQIVIPQKWLYRLPPQFADPLAPFGKVVLIAERLDLMPAEESEKIYIALDDERMLQILKLIVSVDGLDVWIANMPMTCDGKIAFVDTERARPL